MPQRSRGHCRVGGREKETQTMVYWRPGASGAYASKHGQTKQERKANAINDAARFVRYARHVEGRDPRRTATADVRGIIASCDQGDGARFAGTVLSPHTRAALGRPSWVTVWRIARISRRGEHA